MTPARFDEITGRYASLRVAVLGDYCLDRYLEIDPSIHEISIETGLPVHHVIRVRAQAGGAGTVVNNLSALGLGEIHAIGFCGEDGEGYELRRALQATRGVQLGGFHASPDVRTFTYCKPILVTPGAPPQELNRLDSRNWKPTSDAVQQTLVATGVSPDVRVRDLTDEDLVKLRDHLEASFKLEGDLRREVAADIRRKVEIGSYEGLRHRRGLPVRGQRTKTNARTRKGPKRTVAGKKKAGRK